MNKEIRTLVGKEQRWLTYACLSMSTSLRTHGNIKMLNFTSNKNANDKKQ